MSKDKEEKPIDPKSGFAERMQDHDGIQIIKKNPTEEIDPKSGFAERMQDHTGIRIIRKNPEK